MHDDTELTINYYTIHLKNDIKQYQFVYELERHTPAQLWADMMMTLDVSKLRAGLDPWRGRSQDLSSMTDELTNLIAELNLWIPNKITASWDSTNPKDSLNQLHIHFPDLEKIYKKDLIKRGQLARYNDLIHGIEQAYHATVSGKDSLRLLLCPVSPRAPIMNEDYQLFSPEIHWGDLLLHYPHVGRHPLELCLNNDRACPQDQIVPQHEISAFHTLRFHDQGLRNFQDFYHNSKLAWPYALDDPKLAVGYIRLGKLISVDHNTVDRDTVNSIVNSCSSVAAWTID
jgi:hypothetical protein